MSYLPQKIHQKILVLVLLVILLVPVGLGLFGDVLTLLKGGGRSTQMVLLKILLGAYLIYSFLTKKSLGWIIPYSFSLALLGFCLYWMCVPGSFSKGSYSTSGLAIALLCLLLPVCTRKHFGVEASTIKYSTMVGLLAAGIVIFFSENSQVVLQLLAPLKG